MNNYINYYYQLYPKKIENSGKNYIFTIDLDKYYLIPYERSIDELDTLIKLNKEMIIRNSLVHEIILTKNKEPLILIDGLYYSLIRIYVDEKKIVTLEDIFFMLDNNDTIVRNNILDHTNWEKLWETKIDYFEYHIGHLIKKYPFIYKTIDYYIGLGENAITYVKTLNKKDLSFISISHKRIGTRATLFDLYNPYNLIVDYKVRDIAEYTKDAFFNNCDVYMIIKKIMKRYIFNSENINLFFARLLFPSYYFDLYENVMENNLNENIIMNILKKSSEYEDFLRKISEDLSLSRIEWLSNY